MTRPPLHAFTASRSRSIEMLLVFAALMVFVALLGACGQMRSATTSDGPATTSAAAAPADELRLGLTEWSIETGDVVLQPGEVTVRVTNSGGTGHDVVIHGRDGKWASPVLAPGDSHALVITAVPGEELHLVCTLTGHESQGMHTSIEVADE